ncbi:MAG: hypothetical protein U0795_18430 [Pirellulales bacterium]
MAAAVTPIRATWLAGQRWPLSCAVLILLFGYTAPIVAQDPLAPSTPGPSAPASVTPGPSGLAKPEWISESVEKSQSYGAIRVEASGRTLPEAQANLQQEISLAVYKQLELQAERVKLPADLAAQLRPEDIDASALLIDRVVEAIPSSDATSPMDAHYQAWARLRFQPQFPAAVQQQVQRLIQHQRVKQVAWLAGSGLLAVVLSFGYLQMLSRLPASWAGKGLAVLGLAWMAAVTTVAVALYRLS